MLLSGQQRHAERLSILPAARCGARDTGLVPSVHSVSLSVLTPNAPLLHPPLLIGRLEAERWSGRPIRARFPTDARGHAPRGGRRRRPDSSHWQTRRRAGLERAAVRSSAAAVGRAALQRGERLGARSLAGRPRIVPGPDRGDPGRASQTGEYRARGGRARGRLAGASPDPRRSAVSEDARSEPW